MRVLILSDSTADFAIFGHPEQIATLEGPGKRREIALLLPSLDPTRVQLQFMALREPAQAHSLDNPVPVTSLNARGSLDLAAGRRLARLCRDADIELIHALTARAAVYAAVAGRLAELPTLASLSEVTIPPRQDVPKYLLERLNQFILRWGIDRLIVPSDLIRQAMWQINYPRERMEVIYPGVEMRDLEASVPARAALGLPDGPMATMIAPLVEDQGFTTIQDMVPRLLTRVPDAVVAIVGTGPLLMKAQQHSHKLPIHWLGEHVNVRDVIAASNVIIIHPQHDGLPRVVFEAAAAAKPIVSSRVAGVAEIVEQGTTGSLVTYDDSRDLAIQVGRYLLQATRSHDHGMAAYEQARRRYSLEAERAAVTTLYESVIYARR